MMEQHHPQPQPPTGQVPAPAQQQTASWQAVPSDKAVIATPRWLTIVRAVQIVLSIIILGLCAWAIHGAYLDCEGFAIAVSVITWATLTYTLLTEKVPSLRPFYHVFAVLALELFLVIMWLSAMAAVGAERAKYKYKVQLGGCYNDGSLVSSNFCTIARRRSLDLEKRAVVLTDSGMDGMVATACLSALEFILFGVTFGWILRSYLAQRKPRTHGTGAAPGVTESKQPYVANQPYGASTAAPSYQQSTILSPQATGYQNQNQQQQQQQQYYPPQQQPQQQPYQQPYQQPVYQQPVYQQPPPLQQQQQQQQAYMSPQYSGGAPPVTGYPPPVSPANSPPPQQMYGQQHHHTELPAAGVSPEGTPQQGHTYPHVPPQEMAGHAASPSPVPPTQELPTQQNPPHYG